ncbi:hypothetical protein MNBD_ALPHA01-803, partial [hydrothermal vent metagenome]
MIRIFIAIFMTFATISPVLAQVKPSISAEAFGQL